MPQSAPPVSPWPDLPVGPPRIIPTPRPPRSRLVPGILVGLLAGLVLFGPAGYLFRAATAHPQATPTRGPTSAASSATGTLSAFERNQLAINQPKVTGDLAPFARSWLPYITGCNVSGVPNGPKLGDGESTRVVCRYGGVTVYFVQFTAAADRDRSLGRRKSMAADAKPTLPGMADPQQRKAASGNASGNYVEYGFKAENGRQYAAIWWDNTETAVGGFLVAEWKDGLNESWEPLRDLWQRYS
jgi:hypothetical protein